MSILAIPEHVLVIKGRATRPVIVGRQWRP